MFSLILLSEDINKPLESIDSILKTLNSNPALLKFIDKFFVFSVIIAFIYIGYRVVMFILSRLDKKRCDNCMKESFKTINKAEATIDIFNKYLLKKIL